MSLTNVIAAGFGNCLQDGKWAVAVTFIWIAQLDQDIGSGSMPIAGILPSLGRIVPVKYPVVGSEWDFGEIAATLH